MPRLLSRGRATRADTVVMLPVALALGLVLALFAVSPCSGAAVVDYNVTGPCGEAIKGHVTLNATKSAMAYYLNDDPATFATTLYIESFGSSSGAVTQGDGKALLGFDGLLNAVPDDAVGIRALLTVTTTAQPISSAVREAGVSVARMLQAWNGTLTWSTATLGGNTEHGIQTDGIEAAGPPFAVFRTHISSPSAEYRVDITGVMRAWLAGEPNHGVLVQNDHSDAIVICAAGSSCAPRIDVWWDGGLAAGADEPCCPPGEFFNSSACAVCTEGFFCDGRGNARAPCPARTVPRANGTGARTAGEACVVPEPAHASCLDWKLANPSASSGMYPISLPGAGIIEAYCDMHSADGGGWMLVSTEQPGASGMDLLDLPRSRSIPLSDVGSRSSLYSGDVYDALATQSPNGYEVMAEEIVGSDRAEDLVMAFRLDFGVSLRWDGTSSFAENRETLHWRTPFGHVLIEETSHESDLWAGFRVYEGFEWGVLVNNALRCVRRANFSEAPPLEVTSFGGVGAYEQFHTEARSSTGSTRCTSVDTENGISHW